MRVLKSLTMGVLVLATASCASAPPLKPAAVNVTGDWVGAWTCDYVGDGNGVVVLGLTQDGARVGGTVLVTNSRFGRVSNIADAVVSGDTVLTSAKDPAKDVEGTFTVSGDRMTGPFKTDVCQGKIDVTRESWTGTLNTSRLRTSVLTVEAIDVSNRWITLRGPAGGTLTMQVDERVKNLQQVAVGDTVSVAYYESWALSLDGSPDASSASVGRTTTGAGMPAVYSARRTNVRATVTAIDAGKPSVTLRGPRGAQEVSVANDPRVLARLKVGESYDVSYTEHLAMIVEKTAKR